MARRLDYTPIHKTLAQALGLFLFGIGSTVLLGWMLDNSLLKSILPGFASMKSNTALFFMLSGISLWLRTRGQLNVFAIVCAGLVALGGLLTLSEYLFGNNLGIDQLLFHDGSVRTINPGRMAPATATVFFLLGIAMVFPAEGKRFVVRDLLVIFSLAICSLALIGYLYGVSSLYKMGAYSSMAVHTAVSFILLCLGIFSSRPDAGLMRTLLADTPGGVILRRFLPVCVLVPVVLGWIRLWGERQGFYDTPFGLALMVSSLIATLTIFVWLNAQRVTHIDKQRNQIHESLNSSELRFRSTLESMIEGCQIIGYDWRYLYLNNSAVEHSHKTKDELLGHTMMECYPGIENTPLFEVLKRCMEARIPNRMFNEFVYPNGAKGWFELSIQPAPDGIFILSSDITLRKKAEQEILELNTALEKRVAQRTAELAQANEELQKLSLVDVLTGLYNRRGFMLLAEEQLAWAKRTNQNLLLFYADLDNLKQINDQKGHAAGDDAIISASLALSETFRSSDIKARLGGDEFIVLAVEAEEHDIQIPLTRLRTLLHSKRQTMSVGVVSIAPENQVSLGELMICADEAMYSEKRSKPRYRS